MTLIPLLVINGDFYLRYGLGLVLVVVLYGLGLPSRFPFLILYELGLPSRFLFQVLYKFGTGFLIEYDTDFRLVLSQVGSVPQLYLRSFEVEEKP